MKLRTFPVGAAAVAATLACSSAPVKADQKPGPKPAETKPAAAAPAPAPAGAGSATAARPGKLGPVGEKAQLLREAAEQLEKAGQLLERGNKNLAEQLFSTAELLVGPEALAQLAPMFRE